MRKCPYCVEEIQDEAIKCKHCGGWLKKDSLFPLDAPDASSKAEPEKLKTRWLRFWTYVYLPLSCLAILGQEGNGIVFVVLGQIVFTIFVFVGLKRRRKWGWWLNWGVIALHWKRTIEVGPIENYFNVENLLGLIAVFLLGGLIWVLPNSIYFYKRRVLFN